MAVSKYGDIFQERKQKRHQELQVVYRQGRSTIFRMPIYPMLNQCQ